MPPGTAKRLVVTADDFGASTAVNLAVERAQANGILTSASLMVAGDAFDDAVERARRLPGLGVGLHVVVVDGRPWLPEAKVSRLLNGGGRFRDDAARAGLDYWLSGRARAQLAAEVRAQFEAFAETGLALDHVDAHHHMQLHPTVRELIVDLAREFGAPAVRVPDEPVLEALCADGRERRRRRMMRLALAPFTGRLRARAGDAGLATNDAVFGLYDSGAMDTERLVRVLAHLPDGLSELYLHPATGAARASDRSHPRNSPPAEREYRALVHPRVVRAVESFRVELTSYGARAG